MQKHEALQPPPPFGAIMKDAPWQGNAPFGEGARAAGPRTAPGWCRSMLAVAVAVLIGRWPLGEWLCSRLFMPQRHPSLDLIAHQQGQLPGYGHASPDGRYQAALIGTDTVIVDIAARRMHRAPGVYPRGFDRTPPDGTPGPVLRVEGEETATAFAPAWTDLQWIALHGTADDFWSPWPDPRTVGLPPVQEQLPTEWTSDAPPATERVSRSATDRAGWLVALAVLVFMAVFGFQAITWALAGGWQWLWLGVGVPMFAVFSVLVVVFVVTTLRERRRVRVALENLSLERGEGFRVGAPLDLRLRASVPAASEGERTVAPARIAVRLMCRRMRRDADGGALLVDECRDEAIAPRDDTRADRLVYACTLSTDADADDAAPAQWFVTLHAMAQDDRDEMPFLTARLRLLR